MSSYRGRAGYAHLALCFHFDPGCALGIIDKEDDTKNALYVWIANIRCGNITHLEMT